jgi:transposase
MEGSRLSGRGLCLQRGPQGEPPEAHLKGFRGLLQTDGYKGFNRGDDVTHTLCWAHARWKFYDIAATSKVPVPLTDGALRRIGELYTIEARIADRPADERLALRREYSRPLTDTMHVWMKDRLERVPGGSNIAKAFRYVLSQWDGLTVFLNDGRCEIDTNPVERQMRPVALGRKKHDVRGRGFRRTPLGHPEHTPEFSA